MSPETTKTLFTHDQILTRIDELAQTIALDYQDKNLLLVCILKGAAPFLTELSFALHRQGLTDVEWDFMTVTSYGGGTQSSRNPQILHDLRTDIENKHVLLVEDIIDTGYSLDTLVKILNTRNPASLEIATLLSKPSRREVKVSVKYTGFEIDDLFIVGFGLDLDENYRAHPDIIYFP